MNLQKIICLSRKYSRRGAEELIKQGRVDVNNIVVYDCNYQIKPSDKVKVDDEYIKLSKKKIVALYYKPKNVICTMKDPKKRFCVGDVIRSLKLDLIFAGRLDFKSEGLMILTNDGDIAYKISHPKFNIKKEYIVKIKGVIDAKRIKFLEKGVRIDNYKTKPAKIKIIKYTEKNMYLSISISEGKNRQIRKMFDKFGYFVLKLKRIKIHNLSLGNLKLGEIKFLTNNQIIDLEKSLEKLTMNR